MDKQAIINAAIHQLRAITGESFTAHREELAIVISTAIEQARETPPEDDSVRRAASSLLAAVRSLEPAVRMAESVLGGQTAQQKAPANRGEGGTS